MKCGVYLCVYENSAVRKLEFSFLSHHMCCWMGIKRKISLQNGDSKDKFLCTMNSYIYIYFKKGTEA